MKCLSTLQAAQKAADWQAPTLLIDADLYLFTAAIASEEETDWGDDVWSLRSDLKVAKKIFTTQMEKFSRLFDSPSIFLCLSDSENFRKSVYAPYKSNRKKTRKPVGYKALVEWAKETWPYHIQGGLEGDDVMGILGSNPDLNTVIISDDKDMKTIPGRLCRPTSDEVMEITKDEAEAAFLTQVLSGDSTDGYPGLKGIGPVSARKILGNRPDWGLVERAFLKANHTVDEALAQARCARILRQADWDQEAETIKLWVPGQ